MKTIVAYCRTASASGNDPISGITHQVNEILRYAADHGLTVHEMYLDMGMSGISLERAELQRLLADCRDGKIDTVLTTEPERLSRNTGQLFVLLDTFCEIRRARRIHHGRRAQPLCVPRSRFVHTG